MGYGNKARRVILINSHVFPNNLATHYSKAKIQLPSTFPQADAAQKWSNKVSF